MSGEYGEGGVFVDMEMEVGVLDVIWWDLIG